MNLTFVPMLQIQRDLYSMPRNMERFKAYIAAMTDPATGDLKLPLSAMNPMGKDHVPELLDGWMALDAEGIAAHAVVDAAAHLHDVPGDFRVGLVIADDAQGRWTNRYLSEFGQRFGSKPMQRRGWITGLLWTSELPSAAVARETTLTSVYRAAYVARHGYARTLGQMLAQEGYATRNAGCTSPVLESDDLEYTREVIGDYLGSEDQPTIIACLYGDEAATSLGFRPLGFSHRAGFALALADAVNG